MIRGRVIGTSLALAALVSPGLAFADGPFQFHAVTPCRVVDTRTVSATQGTDGNPFARGAHSFRIQGQCGVPVGAKAATLNATIVSPNRNGDVRMWPAGSAEPVVSTLNFLAGEPALANGAIVPLGPDGGGVDDLGVRLSMQNPAVPTPTTHFVLDVTGYFQ